MSGLAEILLSLGYEVSGPDMKSSAMTKKLENMGIKVFIGHAPSNIEGSDLIVYTAAVKESNPELSAARQAGKYCMDRATLLGLLMKRYNYGITVSGTHGKTTTTSMISMIMLEAGMDPTIHIGGELTAIGGTTRIGGSKYFIAEACEYCESFLKFYPYMAVILNIEFDHADYFRDMDHVLDAFRKYMQLVPEGGYVVGCADDAYVMQLIDKLNCNRITYGLSAANAAWTAKDVSYNESGCASYTLVRHGEKVEEIRLGIPGAHNISNSLAAIAACHTLGCSMESIKNALANFSGTHRRFEFKGEVKGVKVVDDYAHHPSEVQATLRAAANGNYSRIWCVFQPHTYTRTKALLEDFAVSFGNADKIILADIYAAREQDTGEINSGMLANKISEKGKQVSYIKGFDAIVKHLQENVQAGDLVITMGAGDIYRVGEMFLSK
jgi:UDP-N-acetylmuramate--alanine ligase